MEEPIVIDDDGDDEESRKGADMKQASGSADDTSGATECLICTEPYGEDGSHRAAVLKCGHFAGEPCLTKWVRLNKRCPTCRKAARPRDLVIVYNLPTVLGAAGGGAAPPAAAASANPSALAEKELMLQKVQRKCTEAEQQARRAAEEKEHGERENKRLRLELEETQRRLAAVHQAKRQQQEHQPQQYQRNPHTLHPSHAGFHSHSSSQAPPGPHPIQPHMPPPPPQQQSSGQEWVHHPQPYGYGTQHVAPGQGQAAPGIPLRPPQDHYTQPGPPVGAGGAAAAAQAAAPPATQPVYAPPYASSGMWGCYGGAGGSGGGGAPAQPPGSLAGGVWGHPGSAPYGAAHRQQVQAAGAAEADHSAGSISDHGHFEKMFSLPARGCRLLALDGIGGRLLVSESPDGGVKCSGIRKISLYSHQSSTFIRLGSEPSIIYDLQLPTALQFPGTASAAAGGAASRLAAVVTRGSGLSLVCTRADNVVGSFSRLPCRPQSCSWVAAGGAAAGGPVGAATSSEHLLLAGLEKGHLALLDIRRLGDPVAVTAAMRLQGPKDCAEMPVRVVAALPAGWGMWGPGSQQQQQQGQQPEPEIPGSAAGVAWPTCIVSCAKGAWLLQGGDTSNGGDAASGAAAPALVRLDQGPRLGGTVGGVGMNIESVCVQYWDAAAACGEGSGQGEPGQAAHQRQQQPAWRVALSRKPAATGTAQCVHDVGIIRKGERQGFMHEASLDGHSRLGLQAVRSCFIPPAAATNTGTDRRPQRAKAPLLASADDLSRQPLIWSLSSGEIVQRLDPHPEPPVCLAAVQARTGLGPGGGAAGGALADCYLACGSASSVAVYRRRAG